MLVDLRPQLSTINAPWHAYAAAREHSRLQRLLPRSLDGARAHRLRALVLAAILAALVRGLSNSMCVASARPCSLRVSVQKLHRTLHPLETGHLLHDVSKPCYPFRSLAIGLRVIPLTFAASTPFATRSFLKRAQLVHGRIVAVALTHSTFEMSSLMAPSMTSNAAGPCAVTSVRTLVHPC